MNFSEMLGIYRLVSRLAHGAMGEVWEAECTEAHAGLKAGDRVALKLVPEFLLHDGMLVERLKREAEAISRLKQPSIVKFHELGEADGRVFMVLELLRGETLAERLAKEKQLPITEIERIGGAIAGALAYIHGQGIYHRDLKPQNIFLTENGAVKLIDLGVAKVLDEASLTMTGSHFGTPAYMSPESFRDSKSVTGAADVWSLGVILYEMATGQLPFPGNSAAAIIAKISDTRIIPQSPSRLRPDLPDELAGNISVCLERDPLKRRESVRPGTGGNAARAVKFHGWSKKIMLGTGIGSCLLLLMVGTLRNTILLLVPLAAIILLGSLTGVVLTAIAYRPMKRGLGLLLGHGLLALAAGIGLAGVLFFLAILGAFGGREEGVVPAAASPPSPVGSGISGSAPDGAIIVAPGQWKQYRDRRVRITAECMGVTGFQSGNRAMRLAPDVRVWATAPEFAGVDLEQFIGKTVTVTGMVHQDPQYGWELRIARPADIQPAGASATAR